MRLASDANVRAARVSRNEVPVAGIAVEQSSHEQIEVAIVVVVRDCERFTARRGDSHRGRAILEASLPVVMKGYGTIRAGRDNIEQSIVIHVAERQIAPRTSHVESGHRRCIEERSVGIIAKEAQSVRPSEQQIHVAIMIEVRGDHFRRRP